MNEEERELTRKWLRKWQELGPILEELRREDIRSAVTTGAIAAFDDAFETSVRDFPPKPHSGLIEQQRLFKKLRERERLKRK